MCMCTGFYSFVFDLADVCQGCISQTAKYEREVQDLRRQLELANEKINELEVSIQYTVIHILVKMSFDMYKIVSKLEDHQTKLFNLIGVPSSIIFPIWFVNILNPFDVADIDIYNIIYVQLNIHILYCLELVSYENSIDSNLSPIFFMALMLCTTSFCLFHSLLQNGICTVRDSLLMHINPEKEFRGSTVKQAITRREPRQSTRNTANSRIAYEVIRICRKLQR